MFKIIKVLVLWAVVGLTAEASNIGFLRDGLLQEFTQSDIELLQKKYMQMLNENKPGDVINWGNTETKNGGSITVIRQFKQAEKPCKRLMFKSHSKQQKSTVYFNFCLIEQQWNVVP
jgi:hypothetical protein